MVCVEVNRSTFRNTWNDPCHQQNHPGSNILKITIYSVHKSWRVYPLVSPPPSPVGALLLWQIKNLKETQQFWKIQDKTKGGMEILAGWRVCLLCQVQTWKCQGQTWQNSATHKSPSPPYFSLAQPFHREDSQSYQFVRSISWTNPCQLVDSSGTHTFRFPLCQCLWSRNVTERLWTTGLDIFFEVYLY